MPQLWKKSWGNREGIIQRSLLLMSSAFALTMKERGDLR